MKLNLMKSSLFKNTYTYTLTSILNAAIPFLLLPILTRYMTPEEYGRLSMFLLLISFTSPFIDINLSGSLTRKYYDRDTINIWEYVFNSIVLLVVTSLMVGGIFWSFSKTIADLSSFPEKFLWMVIVYSFCQSLSNIVLALWRVQNKALLFGLFNTTRTILNLTLSLILVVSFRLGWIGRLYGQLIAMILFAGITIYILLKNKWVQFRFNKTYMMAALAFGMPLVPHALSGSIISMTDRYFITTMIGLSATGIYSVGYQVGSLINLLTTSFNNAYVPWLFSKLTLNREDIKIKIVRFTYLYFIAIIILSLLLGVLAPGFLSIFLGRSFTQSSSYVIWVAVGYAFNGMYFMVVNYIFYAQKNNVLAAVTFATSLFNVILNYFFIKRFGAIGAAQATTIVFATKFLMVWIISAKIYSMPWKKALIK